MSKVPLNRGTSLMRNRHPVGPCSRTMPGLLWRSYGRGRFLMSEVPLYGRVLGGAFCYERGTPVHVQGYLADKKQPLPRTLQ